MRFFSYQPTKINSASAFRAFAGRLVGLFVMAASLALKLGHQCFLALGFERLSEMFDHLIDIAGFEAGIGQWVHQVSEVWLVSFR